MKYSKQDHGYGYEGIYNFIAKKHDCVAHTSDQIGSYQGDAIACFIRKDGMVGVLDHCFGSCSGCDDYEASDMYFSDNGTSEQLIGLADGYEQSVRWDTKENTLKRCDELWLEGQAGYYFDKEKFEKFYRDTIPNFIKANR